MAGLSANGALSPRSGRARLPSVPMCAAPIDPTDPRPDTRSDRTGSEQAHDPGFAPISLRPAIDVAEVQEQLRALGQTRSTTAMAERTELLRLLGRLDEALTVAEETYRLVMFTGDRADLVAARVRRAHVLHDLGRYERAAAEAALARDTATIEEWSELEGAAAEIEGWSLYELARFAEARAALSRAYDAFRAAGAPQERTQALREAIDASMRASMTQPHAAPDERADPVRAAATRVDRPR